MTDPTARDLIQRPATEARAYLATPEPAADGPAVPDGREPASVVDKPSDQEIAVLARYGHQPTPEPVAGPMDIPKNCWLDDEPPCPSPCVFDDPQEIVENCTYASNLQAQQRPKESCRYYRNPTAATGPTDEELLGLDELRDAWNAQADAANSWDELGLDEIVCFAQQHAFARWGHQPPQPIPLEDPPGQCPASGS